MTPPDPLSLTPTNLPPNPYNLTTHLHKPYDDCLVLQDAVLGQDKDLVHARLLGYLLLYPYDDSARDSLAKQIAQCKGEHSDLLKMGKSYNDHLIQLFRQHKAATPPPSDHPSRPSFEYDYSYFLASFELPPVTHKSAKALALHRDGYRCLMTGAYDVSYLEFLTANDKPLPSFTGGAEKTHATHIIPTSTNAHPHGVPDGCPIMTFAHINGLDELNGVNMHRLSNVLTLAGSKSELFDDLRLWFEEDTTRSNTYFICASQPFYLTDFGTRTVTFGNASAHPCELPDPRYLKLHAAVCKIAHLSGAIRYMERRELDEEERGVLAIDGSSADSLELRLAMSDRRVRIFR